MTSAQVTLRDLLFRRCHNFGKRAWQHEIAAAAGLEQSVFSRVISGAYPLKAEWRAGLARALRCTDQELEAAAPPVSSCDIIYKIAHSPTKVAHPTNKKATNGKSPPAVCRKRPRGRK